MANSQTIIGGYRQKPTKPHKAGWLRSDIIHTYGRERESERERKGKKKERGREGRERGRGE